MSEIQVSIVVYNTPKKILIDLLQSISIQNIPIDISIIDNSKTPYFQGLCDKMKIDYYHLEKNIGYGCAHNIALKKSLNNNVKYHIVINPDVKLNRSVIIDLKNYMDLNKNVGLITPKIFYNNGEIQYLCKLYPHPARFALRKILRNSDIVRNHNNYMESEVYQCSSKKPAQRVPFALSTSITEL